MTIIQKENIETCRDRIIFSFDKEKVTATVDDIVETIKKNQTPIKGFRKGRAPDSAIKTTARKYIIEEVKRRLISEAFQDIIFETKIKPFGSPDIKEVDVSMTNFKLDMEVPYFPTFELNQHKGFNLTEPTGLPTIEELTERTKSDLQTEQPNLRPYNQDDFAMDGDTVFVNYNGTINGKSFENSNATNVMIQMNGGMFVREFEVNIMGMHVGEKREFDIAFTSDHNVDKKLVGKTVHFDVELANGVKKEVAEIDDAFAQKIGLENLEALNQKIAERVNAHLAQLRSTQLQNQAIDLMIASNPIDIPDWMSLSAAENLARSRTLNWNECTPELRQGLIAEAAKALKTSMILNEIRGKEVETALSHDEIENVIKTNLRQLPPELQTQFLSQNGMMSRLYAEIQDTQVLDWVVKNSTVGSTTEETKEENKGE